MKEKEFYLVQYNCEHYYHDYYGKEDNELIIYLTGEGFKFEGGNYNCNWYFVDVQNKKCIYGRPGVSYGKIIGNHAITFEEFVIIYNIYNKYNDCDLLGMKKTNTFKEIKHIQNFLKVLKTYINYSIGCSKDTVFIPSNYKDNKDIKLPQELIKCLDKLKDYLHKELKKFELDYGVDPLKLNYLCFIYKDVVYSIKPETMDLPCDVLRWLYGTYFENHCPLMINIMKRDLGIKYAKYGGMLD